VPVVSYLPTEILDYIETHRPADDAEYGIGQKELAKALGYHACSMSRPLSDLVRDGLLAVRRAPVRGGIRKQLVYQLTGSGRDRLRKKQHEVPILTPTLPPPPNPFVGRRDELRALAGFARGGGTAVHLEGPSGVGKSALVARALRRLRLGKVPFWFTVRPASTSRHFTQALAHALSSLGSPQLAYYAQLPREPNGREVADLVRRALGDKEFVGVIDDAQASAPEFRGFLSEFAEAVVGRDRADLLVIISQEGPFLAPGRVPLQVLLLEGIDRAAAHSLTDRRGGLGDRFESVYQATRGNPMLLQLAVVVPGADVTASNLPAAVVRRLADADVEGLIAAAVANEPVPLNFLRSTGGLRPERVGELLSQGLLQRAAEGRVEVLQAVRAALISRVTPAQVRAAHLELARFYGRSHRTEAVRERFLHLVAGEAWRLAGELLARQETPLLASGYSEALRNALVKVARSSQSEAVRVQALQAEAQLLRVHSDYGAAIASLRRAAAESRRDPRVEAECHLSTVELHARLQQIDEARAAIERARATGVTGSRRIAIMLAHADGRLLEAEGKLPAAMEAFSNVFEDARRAGQADLALEALARWSRLVSNTTNWQGVEALIEAGITEARQSGRMDIVFSLVSTRARHYLALGHSQLALVELEKVRAEAESLGYLSQLVNALSGLSAVAGELGRLREAAEYARRASDLAERLGNQVVYGHTLAIECGLEVRQGRFESARERGERAIEVLSKLTPSDSLPVAHSSLAEAFVRLGQFDSARHHYDEAMRLCDVLGMPWFKERVREEIGANFA
jgi:tetratricopeptide (TPR) repeat protein/DNA-binding MarR family transcriptional regulator